MTNNSALRLQAQLSGELHMAAKDRDYIINDAIMVETLNQRAETYMASWLDDKEFEATFKGNTVGYYLGLTVNALCGGMVYADAWADGEDRLSALKYDEIYDGGVWNNVFILLEMTDDNEKKDFQNFILEMYEKWVVELQCYFKQDDAKEYILYSLCAFFQLGVSLRLDILGY